MADDNDPGTPLRPDQREQAELQAKLRRGAEVLEQATADLTQKILEQRGSLYEQGAAAEGITDPETRKQVAAAAARIMAEDRTQPGRVFFRDERGLIPEARAKVDEADALRQQELEADKAKLAATSPAGSDTLDEAEKQRLVNNAMELGKKDSLAASAWVTQAETLDRQRHQSGHYDPLRTPSNGRPSPPDAPPTTPSPPSPPAPQPTSPTARPGGGPPPTHSTSTLPLAANEVLSRFGNPELQGRYEKDQQERRQREETASMTPATATSVIARANAPGMKPRESDILGDFVSSSTKKKVEEERAEREKDPARSQGRGGRGGR